MGRGRKLVVAAVAAVALAVFGARVWFVNAHAQAIPVQTHQMGEKVDLDGNFLEFASEKTEGYSITVLGARAMTSREYAEAYAAEGVDVDAGLGQIAQGMGAGDSEGEAALDEKTEIVLDVEVRNDGNEDGYLMAMSWRVIPDGARDAAYQPDFSLWSLANPAMGSQIGFTIRSGTTMTLHIPFYRNLTRPPFKSDDYSYVAVVGEEPFFLQVSNVPVRQVVELGVPAGSE